MRNPRKIAWVAGAAAFVVAVAHQAAATPTLSPQPVDPEVAAAIAQGLQEMETQLLTPGPFVPGWSEGGANLYEAAASRPGGVAGNYLLSTDKDGERTLTIFFSGPAAALVPGDWQPVAGVGNMDSAKPGAEFGIGRVEGPLFFVMRGQGRRVGTAYCSKGDFAARMYRSPSGEGGDELPPQILKLMLEAFERRTRNYDLCIRYDTDGAGYRERHFLADGRSLPGMDALAGRAEFVPAAPVEPLLTGKR